MRRLLFVAVVGLSVLGLSVHPAPAITFGTVDTNNIYSNVGSIVVTNHPFHDEHPLEGTLQAGSGTLIHPRVFLTAGHVTADIQGDLDAGFLTPGDIHVSFSPSNDMDPNSWHDVEALLTHPLFDDTAEDWHDVGVVILKHPVQGIPCATLPDVGFLDDLEDANLLGGNERAVFATVGYGATMSRSPPEIHFRVPFVGAPRQYAFTEFKRLEDAWLVLKQNPNSGDGGAGPGDSGGPRFFTTPYGRLILVALTSNGPASLHPYDNAYRIDTPQALGFIEFVLALVD